MPLKKGKKYAWMGGGGLKYWNTRYSTIPTYVISSFCQFWSGWDNFWATKSSIDVGVIFMWIKHEKGENDVSFIFLVGRGGWDHWKVFSLFGKKIHFIRAKKVGIILMRVNDIRKYKERLIYNMEWKIQHDL